MTIRLLAHSSAQTVGTAAKALKQVNLQKVLKNHLLLSSAFLLVASTLDSLIFPPLLLRPSLASDLSFIPCNFLHLSSHLSSLFWSFFCLQQHLHTLFPSVFLYDCFFINTPLAMSSLSPSAPSFPPSSFTTIHSNPLTSSVYLPFLSHSFFPFFPFHLSDSLPSLLLSMLTSTHPPSRYAA